MTDRTLLRAHARLALACLVGLGATLAAAGGCHSVDDEATDHAASAAPVAPGTSSSQ